MKKIIISGVSGVGKSTLCKSLNDKSFNIIKEMLENTVTWFWWNEVTSKQEGTEDSLSKNVMIANRLMESYMNLKRTDAQIYDRSIFDIRIAIELRIKDAEFYQWLVNKYESFLGRLSLNSSEIEYIILTCDFDTMKERVIERNRPDESNNMKTCDKWYRSYHEKYNKLLISELEKQNIKYHLIDTSSLTKEDVLSNVLKIIEKFL